MMISIYKATAPNGKVYIGITKNGFQNRKRKHESDARNESVNQFHNAIREYGQDNIKWEILDIVHDFRLGFALEKLYIQLFNTIYPNGYNTTSGGPGSPGGKHNIGRKLSLEHKQAISKANLGNKHAKGNKLSEEHREILRKTHKGVPKKPESIKKGAITRSKNIRCLNNNKIYTNMHDVKKHLNICRESIRQVLRGNKTNVKGYKFEYVK